MESLSPPLVALTPSATPRSASLYQSHTQFDPFLFDNIICQSIPELTFMLDARLPAEKKAYEDNIDKFSDAKQKVDDEITALGQAREDLIIKINDIDMRLNDAKGKNDYLGDELS